ncbi:DUF4157 domain-containing protein [Geitlerinema splendidum]|nr:DUF4157 domain-containing protein [Geitlerinema splendidum]
MSRQRRSQQEPLHPISTSAKTSFLQTRPFSEQPQNASPTPDNPDLQTQLNAAARFGHRLSQIAIQPKLTVGAPGDRYEQEADSVASQVMSMSEPSARSPIQRETAPEEEELQMKPLAASITPLVQREAALEDEEELQMKPSLQRSPEASFTASDTVENQLNNSKGSGSPLPNEVRSFMEPRFGVNFSQVRVHTDSNAVQMNRNLGAQAFTHGHDVYFGAGKSPTDLQLTAHELTHVVQQTGGASIQCRQEQTLSTHLTPNSPTIQRRNRGNQHVGGDPSQMTFLADSRGNVVGPGEAGFSHRMLSDTDGATEDLMARGVYADARLSHVLPSLGFLDGQIVARARTKERYAGKVRGDDALFAPWGIAKELYENAVTWCQNHIDTMTNHKQQQQERANQYNSWVPRANSFFTSLTRLDAMQNMLGVTDPQAMVSALTSGLSDAADVAARARDAYVGGNLAGNLHIPSSDDTVTTLSDETTQAARQMNVEYLGFQRNLLGVERQSVHAEGETDRRRQAEIDQVKQFVRNVGKTIDLTASVVSGAPATITNVTNTVRHGEAWVGSVRNRRQIMAGQRPTHNPTYMTLNEEGNLVVRNVQTGMDRPAEGGEATASPAGPSLSMPSSVSDVLGQITDFVYASEVREINSRLEQIKSRCDAIEGARELLAIRQATERYQTALNNFALKCNQLQQRIAQRRTDYWRLGVDLDNFARQDRASQQSGQAPGRNQEKYTTILTVVGQIREVLVMGNGAKNGIFTPEEFRIWAQGMEAERSARPPRTDIPVFSTGDQEWSRLSSIHSQVRTFGQNVDLLNELFSGVESASTALMRQLQVGGGSGTH